MNALVTIARAAALASIPFVVVACCGNVEDPDQQLQIEIAEPLTDAAAGDGPAEAVCGATVIAQDQDTGEEIELREETVLNSDGSERCVYRGTVNPHSQYFIRASYEGHALNDLAESNPSCGGKTDPEDTDARLTIANGAFQQQQQLAHDGRQLPR